VGYYSCERWKAYAKKALHLQPAAGRFFIFQFTDIARLGRTLQPFRWIVLDSLADQLNIIRYWLKANEVA
jgi:hypothetical protein